MKLRLHPDAASVPFHDFLGDGQSDSTSRILGASVQALEDFEDPVGVLRVDPNAIVFYRENPIGRPLLGGNVDPGRPKPRNLMLLPTRFWKT